ncbi:glucosaminidase domain-containing protein [Oleispirillum naphthae]|uniref:glucosaminidase domain-containing protein n=1 Tax=Oleispirillum naphthae TaxID=2838853 RepID=UPI0030824296
MTSTTFPDASARPRVALAFAAAAVALGLGALAAVAPPAPQAKLAVIENVREVRTAKAVAPKVVPEESLALAARFDAEGYDWDAVLAGNQEVPSLVMKSLPKDLVHLQNVDLKKSLFFRTLLPLALQINADIEADRKHLLALKAKAAAGEPFSARDSRRLADLARAYKTEPENIEELLLRVDGVPPSLMLAQAAEESGWGTSRFVREGNALFGQWTWSDDHSGIVPAARDEGETHKIRAFASVKGAIAAYVRNLNTHAAYERFRLQRALGASGYDLTATLDKYSERGVKYVDTLRTIMQANNLAALDQARLSKEVLVVRR